MQKFLIKRGVEFREGEYVWRVQSALPDGRIELSSDYGSPIRLHETEIWARHGNGTWSVSIESLRETGASRRFGRGPVRPPEIRGAGRPMKRPAAWPRWLAAPFWPRAIPYAGVVGRNASIDAIRWMVAPGSEAAWSSRRCRHRCSEACGLRRRTERRNRCTRRRECLHPRPRRSG